MKRLCRGLFLAAGLIAATVASAQPSSGPSLPLSELQTQERARAVQQPYNNAPVWREARGAVEGYASIPAPEAGVLIQTGGQNWRALRNGTVATYGGWALVGMLALVGIFYWRRGTIQMHEAPTGRHLERFSLVERISHWASAISFCILAVSGLVLGFGKALLIPILGHTVFSWLAILAKNLHNFVGPVFAVCTVFMFITFVRENLPKAIDLKWIVSAGGLFNDKHVPSEKFNAGEKLWFWGGVMLLGIVVSASGLVLNFPNFGQTRALMQLANIVHLTGAILFMLGAMGHIYMGTLGVAGAYDAMKSGHVDETWAKEHHEIWYQQQLKAAKGPTVSNKQQPVPAGGDD